MRHRKRRGKLNRTTSERKALLRALVIALLKRQRITTTITKAKEARRLAEKIITLGKKAGLANIRRAAAILRDRTLIKELFSEIAPRFKSRQGGYTRIIRLSERRKGDNAPLAILELTELKAAAPAAKKAKKEKAQEPQEQKPEKTPPLKQEAPAPKEDKRPAREEKHPPREEIKPYFDKGKKGFFGGLKRFLKPKTGT